MRGLEVLPEVLECEGGHDQLAAALAFAKAGLPGNGGSQPGWVRLGAGRELVAGDPFESEVRRVVGGLIGRGSAKGAKSKEARAALRDVVEAGLAVQRAGLKGSAELVAKLKKEGRDRRVGRRYGRDWRAAVVTGGVRRVAALKQQAVAAEAAGWHVRAKLARMARFDLWREGAEEREKLLLGRLREVVGIRLRAVRDIHFPRAGPDGAALLRLRAAARGWRFRAARRREEEGLVGPLVQDEEAGLLVKLALGEEWFWREDECVWARRAAAARGAAPAQPGAWEEGRARGVQDEAQGRGGLWSEQLVGRAGEALRLEAERRGAIRDALRRRLIERPRGKRKGGPRVTETARRRARRRADIDEGREADDSGRWVVEEVVDVRLWRGKYNFEARVRWRGLDPATGEEWEPTWLHAKSLDRAAKEEAWAL